MINSFKKVLVLCAHTDDEFGCAGTIVRLIQSGADVHYLALSSCEASVPSGLPRDILVRECRKCLDSLGLNQANIEIGSFEVRYFPRDRQEILEQFVSLSRKIHPDLVLMPSTFDTHQDHAVVCSEGFRAFKTSSIWGYELPQNLITFNNTAFVQLDDADMARKIKALSAYKSQQFRSYSSEAFLRSLATVRGAQINTDYAEAFEVIRLVATP